MIFTKQSNETRDIKGKKKELKVIIRISEIQSKLSNDL